MKHSGRASSAALKLILWTLVALIAIFVIGLIAKFVSSIIAALAVALIVLWLLFVLFTLYFFRDPNPRVPEGPGLIVAPAHGKIDIIDQINEPLFIGGPCQRISIFLSVFDVHVQNAPVAGRLGFYRYTTGQFLNALKAESATHNENALLGFHSTERPGVKIGVRLLAGLIARRIIPFAVEGDTVARGERISLIQFGSRTDLYLPLNAKIKVKLGDRAVGGETILATFE
ncbi:MAG TPA: phosphatidylserine decarboxylase [Verrucomicrobiae bacterium]|jgi:phosphatidylserine decarboxylase|nr:phosphatidylserine decarboxylase [Verrucomicrobiae bacterium]